MAIELTSEAEARVAMTGGGTAGHVIPGLAVAEELARRWAGSVFWIGSGSGIERQLAERAGLPFKAIPAGKLRRYFSLRNVSDIAKVAAGIVASIAILRRERPRLLFSKGGFVSVPPVLAARLLGIPCFTHESDFDPGLATRINARFCEKLLVSFPETLGFLPPGWAGRTEVTGNPVRASLASADPAKGRRFVGCGSRAPLLFIVGGSQGSSFLNGLVASCLPELRALAFVAHQMGEREYAQASGANYFTTAFLADEMPHVLAAADLVVCRSGANTLAELAALGKPSILVPLSTSGSRGDQIRNAEVFRRAGAAIVLREEDASGVSLSDAVSGLLSDRQRLAAMAEKARALGGTNAAARIATLILERVRAPGTG
jgi:UDP-N-acetylglucosamine--N-acetylmuramyl-(pentapeptide) pyrophosphoryl-undecaprenol N-acetylglucosamine transferase